MRSSQVGGTWATADASHCWGAARIEFPGEIPIMTTKPLFAMITLALLLSGNLICTAKEGDGDEAHPPPPNYCGAWVVHGKDGRKITEVSYKEGARHGLARGWHANGELSFVSYYKHGRPEGVSISWDEEGLVQRVTVDEPDGKHRWTEYHANGHRSQEQVYVGGKLLRRRMWHSTGTKAFDYGCKDGKPHGKYTEWHPSGAVRQEGEYENGEPVGMFSCWNEEGKLTRTLHHQSGEIIRIDIYKNDQVVEKEFWEDGKPVRKEKVN